jgi:hypothetical protein
MKKCLKCDKEFELYLKIGDKTHNMCNRKYCLECSPFKKHNTINFAKNDANNNLLCICKYCDKKYKYKINHHKGYAKDICNSCKTTLKRLQIKKKMIDYKGGSCCKCGFTSENMRNLSFHHLHNKKIEIAENCYKLPWKVIKEELDKCILVCCHCHNDIHYEQDSAIAKRMIENGELS